MRRLFFVVLSFMATGLLQGQQRDVDVVERILGNVLQELAQEGNEVAAEQLVEHFRDLYNNPLDINRASEEQLEQLVVLTDFQIQSLLEYRENSGPILSITELQLINGFDKETAMRLAPFLAFGQHSGASGSRKKKSVNSELLVKWWQAEEKDEYVGPPFYSQIKFRSSINDRIGGGFTIEKDAGELVSGEKSLPLGDFFSYHLQAKDVYLKKDIAVTNIVLGDYSIRLGQGLAVWNAFTMGSNTAIQNVYRRGSKVVPYTSSDENRFFRGGAATIRKTFSSGSWVEGTAFFSLKNVDARLDGYKYTSLPSDGLHNTESLVKVRKTLGEMAYGGNLSYRGRKFSAGVNWAGYGYNAENGRRVQDYNRYQMYDGWYGNFSADIAAILGKVRIFAELAMDYGGSAAFLAGILCRTGIWDWAVTGRSYSKSYIAPYAGAYSTTSSCSNQRGVSWLLRGELLGAEVGFGGDYVHYPWKRFGVPEPSDVAKIWAMAEHTADAAWWNVKLYENYNSYGNSNKWGVKWLYGRNISRWIILKGRGEAAFSSSGSSGFAAGADADLRLWGDLLRMIFRCAYYNCREWESRLYMYEHDLPSSFSLGLMYGEGVDWYAMLVCKIGRWCSLYLKGDGNPKLKVGLKLRFF